jgi:hypothetical protein
MIVPIIREIIEASIKLPFDNGRKPNQNIYDGKGPFVWLYPVIENDSFDKSLSILTVYDCVLSFSIPGEMEPGTAQEQAYIDQARGYALLFEQALAKHVKVKEVSRMQKEPFYNFLADNYYGMNCRVYVQLKEPFSKC